jgi:hypothetical protein
VTNPTPHQAPPRRKSKLPWILSGIAAAAALCCGGGLILVAVLGDDTTPNSSSTTTTYGLNQPARDGKFEFTVTKMECGKPELGSGILTKKAQGQYCLFTVAVKNIGNEARTFDAASQRAYGAGEVKYEADSEATIALDNANSFLVDINPGNSVTGQVAFDIPKDAKIVKLELHDSLFSGGVTIRIA